MDSVSIQFPHTEHVSDDTDQISMNIRKIEGYFQMVILRDTTLDLKHVAYITKRSLQDNMGGREEQTNIVQYFVTVRNFYEARQMATPSSHYTANITSTMKFDSEDEFIFLSLSQDGTKVALSSYSLNPKKSGKCYLYHISNNSKTLKCVKTIQAQGRAVFLKDNSLLIVHSSHITKYSKDYNEQDYIHFNTDDRDANVNYFGALAAPSWVIAPSQTEKHGISAYNKAANNLIYNTRLIHQSNSIYIKTVPQQCLLWSLKEGNILISTITREINEHIISFSENGETMVTYNTLTKLIALYNLKSGLKTSEFHSQVEMKQKDFFGALSVRFYNDNKYLAIAGVLIDPDRPADAKVVFEVWYIDSKVSVLCIQNPIQLCEKPYKIYGPMFFEEERESSSSSSSIENNTNDYGIDSEITEKSEDHTEVGDPQFTGKSGIATAEKLPVLMGIYTTSLDGFNLTWERLELDIFEEEKVQEEYDTIEDWKAAISSNDSNKANSGWWCRLKAPVSFSFQKWEDDLIDYSVCFAKCNQDKLYILQIRQYSVLLWRTPIDYFEKENNSIDDAELLFAHGYKGSNFICIDFYKVNESLKTPVFFTKSSSKNERLIVYTNYMPCSDDEEDDRRNVDFTEEIFLPFDLFKLEDTDSDRRLTEFDYFYFKCACQAFTLHIDYMFDFEASPEQKKVMNIISKKIKSIIYSILSRMKKNKSQYFTTASGSDLMTVLAAYGDATEILYQIVRTDELPINIFQRGQEKTPNGFFINDNALISLIDGEYYNLYNLLLNRLLLHSVNQGVGGLSCVTDALVRLQVNHQRDELVRSCNKLSFLCFEPYKLPADQSELDLKEESLYERNLTNFRNLDIFSCQEHLKSGKSSLLWHRLLSIKTMLSEGFGKVYLPGFIKDALTPIKAYIEKEYRIYKPKVPPALIKLCVVPLVHFNSYYLYPEDRHWKRNLKNKTAFSTTNSFIENASNIQEHSVFNEGDTVFEIMLQYKWQTFARSRFFLVCLVHLAFYISYTVGVSFSREIFGYTLGSPLTDHRQIACICLMFISAFILVVQEFHQFFRVIGKINYLLSPYNWVDVTAIILPIVMFSSMLANYSHFDELNSFTALVLWLHGILRMRVSRFVGITLEVIIQLIWSIKEILLLLFLIICAFTNAFIVLLSHKEDEYFQEQYSGTLAASDGATSNVTISDSSTSNAFTDLYKSFSVVWFFIYGAWDPVTSGDSGDNKVIVALSILFSLFTVLIFFNLVIVDMSNKIGEIRQLGKKAWIRHFASVIVEIEQLWCLPSERYNKKMHPSYIYYYGHADDVRKKKEFIKKETEELIKSLDGEYDIDFIDLEISQPHDDKMKSDTTSGNSSRTENQVLNNDEYTGTEHSFNMQLIEHMERSRAMIHEKLYSHPSTKEIQDLNNLMQHDLIYLKTTLAALASKYNDR